MVMFIAKSRFVRVNEVSLFAVKQMNEVTVCFVLCPLRHSICCWPLLSRLGVDFVWLRSCSSNLRSLHQKCKKEKLIAEVLN